MIFNVVSMFTFVLFPPHSHSQPHLFLTLIFLVRRAVQIQRFIEPQSIFKLEPREALDKLKLSLSVCEKVKAHFAVVRAKVKEQQPEKPWDFDTDLIFARFQLYEDRLKMLNAIFQTADDLFKLEKVELSSDKVTIDVFVVLCISAVFLCLGCA